MEVVGYGMTKTCADKAFAQAGFKEGEGRDQVGVIELHDCFAANEVIVVKCLLAGRADEYKAYHIPCSGTLSAWRSTQACWVWWQYCKDNHVGLSFTHMYILQYGGKYVVNPSGGLEAKGHPLGATGLGMHFYITSMFLILSFNISK